MRERGLTRKQAVNDAIEQARADGTYDKLYEKWFGAKPE